MHKKSTRKVVARNKKASFDYDIKKTFLAGIVLKGHEVKSAKKGQISLKGAFVRVMNGEVWLLNAHIARWSHANVKDYDPTRRRKLLLKKREINELVNFQEVKKMTIVPLKAIVIRGQVKIDIGVGKGRKKYDKRRKIKEREMKKQLKTDFKKDKYF